MILLDSLINKRSFVIAYSGLYNSKKIQEAFFTRHIGWRASNYVVQSVHAAHFFYIMKPPDHLSFGLDRTIDDYPIYEVDQLFSQTWDQALIDDVVKQIGEII